MQQGTVKHFNAEKGYGFIIVDGGGDEVFFHISEWMTHLDREVRPLPNKGDVVMFEVERGERGPKAVGVRLADESEDTVATEEPEGEADASEESEDEEPALDVVEDEEDEEEKAA